jgi:integrase
MLEKAAKRGKAKTRGNGRGSIYQLPSGAFRWEKKIDGNKYGGTVRNRTEAEQAISKITVDHARGILAPPDKTTLAEYTARVIARQKHLRPRSVRLYTNEMRYICEIRVGKQKLGEMLVRDVRAQHLKEALTLLSEKDMKGQRGTPVTGKRISPRTLAKVLMRTRSIFKEALQDQLIYASPAEAIKPARFIATARPTEAIGTSLEFADLARFQEIGSLLEQAGRCRVWTMLFALVSVGLRRGEACGLTWADVDFDKGILSIRRARVADDGAVLETGTKTFKSRRDIPMPQSLIHALRTQQARQKLEQDQAGEAWQNTGAVFATSLGNWTHPSHLENGLRVVLKWSDPKGFAKNAQGVRTRVKPQMLAKLEAAVMAGKPLPKLRLHDLRHTYATLALRSGVPIEVVSKNLGHAKISITLDVYRHVLESEQRAHVVDFFTAPIPERAVQPRAVN